MNCVSIQSSTSQQANNNTVSNYIATSNNNIDNEADLAKDIPSAIEKIKELRLKRDQMLAQKDKTAKELEKLTKQ